MTQANVSAIVAACDEILLSPKTAPTLECFLEEHSVSSISMVLQELATAPDSASDADTTIRAIKHLTRSTQAPAPLAKMLPSAQAALAAAAPSLRILGCHIIAQWLRCTGEEADSKQPVSLLLYMLEDGDTDVAEAAAAALQQVASDAERLHRFLDARPEQLQAVMDNEDAIARSRGLALMVRLAGASPEAAQAVLDSGVLERFLDELTTEGDVLARLAALQHLLELAQQESVPSVLRGEVAPHVLALLDASDEPPMQQAAIAAAASLLQSGEDAALVREAVQHLDGVLRADATTLPMHVHVWDAVCVLCAARESRNAVALSSLLPLMAGTALGRGAAQTVRIAAMHALAACAGAEEIGRDSDMLRALLSAKAETALKAEVFEGALPDTNVALGMTQKLLELLQQPFEDIKVPTYRFCTAMAVRPWFALELCQHAALLDFLCSADSEHGALSTWRFGVLRVLEASAAAANGSASAAQAPLTKFGPQLQAAMAQGPYGVAPPAGAAMDSAAPQVAIATRAP
eukprot:jgi/Ulvmu1/1683/UM115_0012.1